VSPDRTCSPKKKKEKVEDLRRTGEAKFTFLYKEDEEKKKADSTIFC